MHIHILGICGTFMAGIARLARELGMTVTGSDAHAYPPMSEQLATLGIDVMKGYEPAHLEPVPDCVVIGNAMTRGNPAVEHVLDKGLPFTSGPAWLAEHVLGERWVLAVSGTHGKTTATSMLTWILECAGYAPGFLIGGVPENFGCSARLGKNYFVVEADEYDSAFFDKRSKFVHYLPKTLVINNLEFDHADIFDDMAAIRRQFHHLVRTVPASGRILRASPDPEIDRVMDMGCWTPVQTWPRRLASHHDPRRRQRLRRCAGRKRHRLGAMAADRAAQRGQRPRGHCGRGTRGRGPGCGLWVPGKLSQRQTAHGSAWPCRRHHRL